jgi:hypothetical protein
VRRFSPLVVTVLVTTLCFVYGNHSWSWLAGPVAGVLVWAFDHKAHEPADRLREPAPVD